MYVPFCELSSSILGAELVSLTPNTREKVRFPTSEVVDIPQTPVHLAVRWAFASSHLRPDTRTTGSPGSSYPTSFFSGCSVFPSPRFSFSAEFLYGSIQPDVVIPAPVLPNHHAFAPISRWDAQPLASSRLTLPSPPLELAASKVLSLRPWDTHLPTFMFPTIPQYTTYGQIAIQAPFLSSSSFLYLFTPYWYGR